MGFSVTANAAATAYCPPGTVVIGGGGKVTQGDPLTAAINTARPLDDASGFSVVFIRVFEVVSQDFETLISAYAICVETVAAE